MFFYAMIAMEVVNVMKQPKQMMLEGMEGSSNKRSPEAVVGGGVERVEQLRRGWWQGCSGWVRVESPSHSAQATDCGARSAALALNDQVKMRVPLRHPAASSSGVCGTRDGV